MHFCLSIAKNENLDSVKTFSLGGNSLTSNLVFYHTQRFPTTIDKFTLYNNIQNSECNTSCLALILLIMYITFRGAIGIFFTYKNHFVTIKTSSLMYVWCLTIYVIFPIIKTIKIKRRKELVIYARLRFKGKNST